jgi:alginate O-acetyltransferase complex protein AlgI
MLFNSFSFLGLFLPLVLVVYYGAAFVAPGRGARLYVLILATMAFYSVAAVSFLPLLLVSIAANYFFHLRINAASNSRSRSSWLCFGVALNLAILCWFKYAGFLTEAADDLLGLGIRVTAMVLPLAISYYTFQQIAFLIDTSRGQIKSARPSLYAASVLLFPYIIAGPITLYREIGPQLERRPSTRDVPAHLLVGLTIFAFGLAKKACIADSLAPPVDALFAAAAAHKGLGVVVAWEACVGYLLEMYFDFSGYSEMALGLGRMFGLTLPLNFYSPLRSTSVIEWWRRWHMTLGRWVNAYVFQPLALSWTRWAASRGLTRFGTIVCGTLCPSFLAMLVIGVWHGGAWTYFIFGALHGTYMVVAETWRYFTRKRKTSRPRLRAALGNVLTLVCVLFAIAPFRAANVGATLVLWRGMLGLSGIYADSGVVGGDQITYALVLPMAFVVLFLFAYLAPNVPQMMAHFEPALEWSRWRLAERAYFGLSWRPRLPWAIASGALLASGLVFISRGATSFVYFGF